MGLFKWYRDLKEWFRVDHEWHDLLWSGVGENDLVKIQKAVDEGADINAVYGYNEPDPPILSASRSGSLKMIRLLVENGADVNKTGEGLATALNQAAGNGYVEIVEFLLEHGADPDARDSSGDAALDYAKKWCSVEKRAAVIECIEKYL